MHEMSIALGIVRIAEDETRKAKAHKVARIELEIGTLAGIEFSSLDFVWPAAVRGTVLQEAERSIDRIQGKARCMDCDTQFEVAHLFDACPSCKSNLKELVRGKELRVKALEVV